MEKAVSGSKRQSSVRLPVGFARDEVGLKPSPPLAQLMKGGGELRLKVLLTTLMMATRAPHSRKVASKDMAAMLGLPDSDNAGARRVSKAFSDLEGLSLVRIDRRPGYVRTVTVLDPTGSGEDWDAMQLKAPYITLPISLWRRGWLISLSGRALSQLVILKELTQGRRSNGAWADGIRKRQYGLSDDTWTRGTRELREASLLEVRERIASSHGETRRRNEYLLHIDRLELYDPGTYPSHE